MATIKFLKEKKEIEVEDGSNLRTEARKAGIDIYPGIYKTFNCRGLGMCCSCRMNVKEGQENVSRQGLWEKLHLMINPFGFFARLGNEKQLRLACQTKVKGDITVETQPEFNWHGEKFWG